MSSTPGKGNMIDVKHLIPDSLERFRDAIAEAFDYFLQRTSTSPKFSPPDATANSGPFEAWFSLALQHPTLHKLAQVLSRNRTLPHDLRKTLQMLESFVPRTPLHDVINVIRDELGEDLNRIQLGDAALAEASVAVVVPFTWTERKDRQPTRGVLKVLKPHVRDRLNAELAVWADVGCFFDDACRRHGLPPINYQEPFNTVATLLRNETDFAGEQRHLAEAAEAMSGVPGVRIPRLLPFCTSRITAMERIDGVKVTDVDFLSDDARWRLAERIVETMIASPMSSPKDSVPFHADPHAGNLLATDDGDLAILDWAMVGTLCDSDREHLSQLLLSAQLLDATGLCRAMEKLSPETQFDPGVLRSVVERWMGIAPNLFRPIFSWVAGLMDAAALECGARFSKDLLLFRKSLLVLEGVIADLIGEGGLDKLLHSSTIRQLIREWPARMFLFPDSRRLGSRLSNLDLLQAALKLPMVAASRWLNQRSGVPPMSAPENANSPRDN